MSNPDPTKPEPKVVKIVCTLCDQPWSDHGTDEPSPLICIDLLKAELARRPKWPAITSSISAQTWPPGAYGPRIQ